MTRSIIKKFIAGLVSLFLILLSPGLFSYQALAGEISKDQATDSVSNLQDSVLPPFSAPITPAEDIQGQDLKDISARPVDVAMEPVVLEPSVPVRPVSTTAKISARVQDFFRSGLSLKKPASGTYSLGKNAQPVSESLKSDVANLKDSTQNPWSVLKRLFDRAKPGSSSDIPKLSANNPILQAEGASPQSRFKLRLAPRSFLLGKKGDSSALPPSPDNNKAPEPQKGFGWLKRLRELPSSFVWRYIPGWSIAAMGGEMQAVALPVFTALLFGLPQAVDAAGINLIMRISGAWLSAFFIGRFSPEAINNAALILSALSGAFIPGAIAAHFSHAQLFDVFLLNSALSGLVYGATRGVTENLIPKRLILDRSLREFGLNYASLWVEVSAIAMALVAVPLLHLAGGSVTMGLSSALFFIATFFYASLRKNKTAAVAATPIVEATPESGENLSWRSYLPFIFFRFMHFSLYSVFALLLAMGVLHSESMTGNIIGAYDFGSLLFGLLATLALLPKTGEKPWTLAGIGMVLAFLWASFLIPIPVLSMALAGAMGGVILINSNKWMSFYQEKLPQSKLKNLSKWMMTLSILAMLPIFAATSLSQLVPSLAAILTMPRIILGANIFVTLFGLVTAWSLKGEKNKPSAPKPPASNQ